MPNTAKALYRGTATTTVGTVLYTVPASTSAVVTNIVVSNNGSSAATYTFGLGGVAFATNVSVPAYGISTLDVRQVLATTQTITGGGSSTSLTFHISGMEIS